MKKQTMMKTILITVFSILLTTSINAQEFEMVKDINPTGNSDPMYFTEYNDKLYFRANDGGINGEELWVTDGTEASTTILKDINPDSSYSYPYYLSITELNGKLYFSANDGVNGRELWVTDGTETGTTLLKDINLGNGDSNPVYFFPYNDKLYFRADDGINGRELWVTDGTEVGTTLLKDINPGSGDSDPYYFIEYNGKLYFQAGNDISGRELWVTDGSSEGTIMLKDIFLSSGSSDPIGFIGYNGKLYFSADNGSNGSELWVTDGTEAGTTIFKDINPGSGGSYPMGFIEYNDKLYFRANDGGIYGEELWVTDGTEAGTTTFKDINPGSGGSYPTSIIEYNGKLYFVAANGIIYGRELWTTDGTEAGTVMLKDINPGSGHCNSDYFNFTEYNGKLYFVANNDNTIDNFQIWVTDGTSENTVMVQPNITSNTNALVIGLNPLHVFDGSLYFIANFDENGRELWKLTTEGLDVNDLTKSEVKLYPNPVRGILQLQTTEKVKQIKLFSMNGQELQSWGAQNRVDLSAYPSGIYLVRIQTEKGITTQKVIINN